MDLGHGTGKGILISSMMHQFDKCCGIELLKNLHIESTKLKDKYDQYIAEIDERDYLKTFKIPHSSAPKFEVVQGDILE